MTTAHLFTFAPFRLDAVNARLWCEKELVSLRPKPFAVLRYLVEHAGRLVTKEELTKVVWPGTYVGESSLKGYIRDLREVLVDDPETPRYIETVARLGYRFIAAVERQASSTGTAEPPADGQLRSTPFVGRERELAQLQGWLGQALQGRRHLVFVTGEPGLGKTTVVEEFLRTTSTKEPLWIGQGQCIEHYGAGEAYLPILEALGHLARTADGEQVVEGLRRYAPTWLVQMPALVPEEELAGLQRKVQGATPERMLRGMAEALEALAILRPVVLWLEDLHWSDYSTLELLASVARRRGAARLLVLGTYRPTDVIMSGHPLKGLKQELHLHRQCEELPLQFLNEAAVGQYLLLRFPQQQFPPSLAAVLSHSTEGNPLFLVNVIEDLLRRETIAERDQQWTVTVSVAEIGRDVPESLRQMVEQRVERLPKAEQRLLEVASVAGATFTAAVVAAGLEERTDLIEEQCEELVRQGQFLRSSGTERWPDGTVTANYGFGHTLYQSVLYGRQTESRRLRVHQRLGVRLEAAFGARARELATELAMHFEGGRDYRRASQYLEQAGKNAMRRNAHVEAISHFTRGLELLKTLPDTPERTQQELSLQIALGAPLMATKGFGAPEVEPPYARARELCRRVGETPQLVPVVWGLATFYGMKGDFQAATELAEQLMRLAQSLKDPAALLIAHRLRGVHLFFSGELTQARIHLEQVIALYDRQQHHTLAFLYGGYDPGVHCLGYMAGTLWHLGYPDQALKRVNEALTLAQDLSHPSSLVYALDWAAGVHWFLREGPAAQGWAEAEITLSTEQGLPYFVAEGTIWRGWALAEQGQAEEGIAQIRQGIAIFQTTGAAQRPEFPALLAEANGRAGQAEEGLSILAEPLAVMPKYGEHYFYAAELYRLKGELTLQSSAQRLGSSGKKSGKVKSEKWKVKSRK